MSDSLRDQLIKAGFSSKEKSKRAPAQGRDEKSWKKSLGPKSSLNTNQKAPLSGSDDVDQKKAIKAKIKQLIEASCLADHKGEKPYNHIVNSRVRRVFVNEDAYKQLVEGSLAITRLNGSTYLIPVTVGREVKALNPDWAVSFVDKSGADSNDDLDYAEHKVPDDLSW